MGKGLMKEEMPRKLKNRLNRFIIISEIKVLEIGTRKGKESGKVEEAVNHQMVKISVILILIKVNLQRKEMVANIKIKVGKRSSIRGRFSATTTIINGDTLQMSVEVAKEVREN